jgi:hypothetical protein
MNVRCEFKLEVTATLGFHSLYNWCFQPVWLFSGAPEDREEETVMEKRGTKAQYCAVKSLMHAIRTEVKEAHLDAAHQMIHNAKP